MRRDGTLRDTDGRDVVLVEDDEARIETQQRRQRDVRRADDELSAAQIGIRTLRAPGWLCGDVRQFMGLTHDIHAMSYGGLMVLTGFQSMAFGFLAGMLPLPGGLVGPLAALPIWREQGSCPLDPQLGMRLVVPPAVAIALGAEVALNSFFQSVLGLRMRPEGAPH